MNTDAIIKLLQNSGFHILGADETFLYLEDPSCILRSFETFIEYAWLAIICITGLFLFGWAISMIRGAKTDYFTNLRNLIIILGTVSAVIPIVNLIWGDDLFAKGCRTIKVSISEINEILDTRNSELSEYDEFKLYETVDIYDSATVYNTPYAEYPLTATEVPPEIETVTVTPDTNTTFGMTSNNTTSSISNYSMVNRPTVAYSSSYDVVYTNQNGTKYRKTGGTRAWRNNNPGNIKYSEFTRRAGAIGEAGGFAVFPDEETGTRAIGQLLRSNSYKNLTIAGAISKYAPPRDNDTARYQRQLQNLTGLSINRRINSLSDTEIARVATAIRQLEGWVPGQIIRN